MTTKIVLKSVLIAAAFVLIAVIAWHAHMVYDFAPAN